MAYVFDKSGTRQRVTDDVLEADGDDGSHVIVLDHGTSTDGRPYWLYLWVPRNKYKEFRHRVAQRLTTNFADYGNIIRYGYDWQAPDNVKQEMAEQYGCDEAYINWLIEDADKARNAFLKQKEVYDSKRLGDIVAMMKKQQATS